MQSEDEKNFFQFMGKKIHKILLCFSMFNAGSLNIHHGYML